MGTQNNHLIPPQRDGSFQHPKQMFKMLDEKIILVSCYNILIIRAYGFLIVKHAIRMVEAFYCHAFFLTLCKLHNFASFLSFADFIN